MGRHRINTGQNYEETGTTMANSKDISLFSQLANYGAAHIYYNITMFQAVKKSKIF